MKKLFILAIAALGMLACTEKNAPDQKSQEEKEEGVIDGKQGDITGCWVKEGRKTEYYNFSSDGYMTQYENNLADMEGKYFWYNSQFYYPDNYYEQLTWETEMEAPYQYDGKRLTVYAGLTTTYTVEWIDGSHVNIEKLGSFIRIDPQNYFLNFKTYPNGDYNKDWQAIMKGHEKHFCVGKDENNNLKWIKFSLGNLQYQASTTRWRFAPHQYAMNRTLPFDNNWADLFSREGYYETICSTFSPEWRFLHYEECSALFTGGVTKVRPNAKMLCFRSTVAGVYGLIILPDAWDAPNGIAWPSGVPKYSDQYSVERWTMMESNGAIFLPATGYSEGDPNAPVWGNVGYYMLDEISSHSIYDGIVLTFSDSKYDSLYITGFPYCASVRLVQDVE